MGEASRVVQAGRIAVAMALALAFAPPSALADRSPGPLSAAHQSLEGPDQCQSCHTDGRALSNDKCLGCHQHEGMRKRIAEGKGLHASEKIAGRACFLCHIEHKGRGSDLLGWKTLGTTAKSFDHQLTGWPLVGAHANTACDQCHTRKGSFGGASPVCESCHKASVHGDLRTPLHRCERCHTQRSWRPIPDLDFNHNSAADARFPIEAKHVGVPCARCHERNVFRTAAAAAPDCVACHQNPHTDGIDAHRRCQLCHSAKGEWKTIQFDHARQARFALDGAHGKTPCAACHTAARPKAPRACEGCHADPHAGRFSTLKTVKTCGGCHSAKSWAESSRFDHQRATGYALTGKHGEIDCRRCHRGNTPAEFERLTGIVTASGVACMSCHQHANAHKKQFTNGECLRCHAVAGKLEFKKKAIDRVHGPSARFPLTEGHADVSCDACHKGGVFQGTNVQCGPACHEDRLHGGALGADCTRCHEGAHWPATRFDHDDTSYPLVGKHHQVACELCHPARAYRPTSTRCADCHAVDDVHKGALGKACEQCHTPSGRSLFDHNDPRVPNRFRLDGKHVGVACARCHPNGATAKVPTDCAGCHVEPARHKGRLGTQCASCHATVGWSVLHTAHDTGAFRFGGAHDRQRCESCHTAGRSLRGTAELCVTCHQRDDIHHNSLGGRCGECHFQEGWSGPQVRFFHERTGCDLRGIHRALPCLDCHVGGNFAALSPTCVGCHRADAVRAAKEDPRAPAGHATLTECSACHNVNYFAPSRPGGGESVCQ